MIRPQQDDPYCPQSVPSNTRVTLASNDIKAYIKFILPCLMEWFPYESGLSYKNGTLQMSLQNVTHSCFKKSAK